MIEQIKTTLDPADVVCVGDWVYRVEAKDSRPCMASCHLYDHDNERCCGYCYRWDNSDEIVFRKIMPVGMLAKDARVCVTPMWSEWQEVQREKRAMQKKINHIERGEK